MKLLFLLLAVFYFSNAFQQNSGYARTMMENHMHAFQNAVKSRNRDLLFKLFQLSDASDAKVTEVFNAYQGYKIKVKSARFIDAQHIRGNVFMLPGGGGGAVSEIEFGLNSNAQSPTGWKIMSAKRA